MQSKAKLGAASLTLAVFMSGCAPMPGATPQASATGDYGNTSTAYSTGSTGGYDYGTAGTTAPAANTGSAYYDYGSGSSTGSSGSSTSGSSSGYDSYYSGNSSTGTSGSSSNYYDYSSSGSSSYGGGNGSATGSYAVQVVASPNRNTAEAMRSQMQSAGFTAVIDQVGGYYKVRIPYSSASEAKASLGRIRSTVPDAFYTTR